MYQSLFYKKLFYLFLLFIGISFLFLIDISTGYSDLTYKKILSLLIEKEESKAWIILWEYRIPLALMAILIGMILGLAGSQMQTLLNNPLADPFTLGISSAAAFGAALAIVFNVGFLNLEFLSFLKDDFELFLITSNAFLFGFSTAIFIYFFSRFKNLKNETLILLGVSFYFIFQGLQAVLKYMSNEDQVQEFIFWTMGSFASASWQKIWISLSLLIISFLYFIRHWAELTALRMGEIQARSLGVNIEKLKIRSLFMISLLASTAVSFVGIIGFIGLISPHLARYLFGEDHRFYIPGALLIGGALLSMSSIISKSVIEGVVIPIGIITSLIGVPLFIHILLRKTEEGSRDFF